MTFAFGEDVEYLRPLRPDHIRIAGEDCLRVVRLIDSALPSLERARTQTQWSGSGAPVFDQRMREATDLAVELRAGYQRAGHAVVDYVEALDRARSLADSGANAERLLGLVISRIVESQSPVVRASAPMHQWNDLRSTQSARDWFAEIGQRDAINKVRDEAERYYQQAGSLYGQAREAEQAARAEAVGAVDQARRALPDFLANTSNALAIIRATPGLREEVYEASKDPNARRPVGILEEFQVAADNRPFVSYPNGGRQVLNQVLKDGEQITLLAPEAEMLDELPLWELQRFQAIKEQAQQAAMDRFPNSADFTDDQADAFRHTYWNALLTKEFGEQWTAQFTIAHETNPANLAGAEAMDLHNNSVGRSIAVGNPQATDEQLADLVLNAVVDGRTVVIDGNGSLIYSDQLPLESTGQPNQTRLPGGPAPTGAEYE